MVFLQADVVAKLGATAAVSLQAEVVEEFGAVAAVSLQAEIFEKLGEVAVVSLQEEAMVEHVNKVYCALSVDVFFSNLLFTCPFSYVLAFLK